MGILKKFFAIIGFSKEENQEVESEVRNDVQEVADAVTQPTRGFSVKAHVPVERSQLGPVLVLCNHEDGGVQGFRWYGKRLKMDEDGDIADEFFNEVFSETSGVSSPRLITKLEIKTPMIQGLKVRDQEVKDGYIHQYVEHNGKLLSV